MGIAAVFAKFAFTEKKILANVLNRCLSINWWIGVDNYCLTGVSDGVSE